MSSTNDELRQLAADGAEDWTVMLAEEQTAGRGRLGRRWHSAPGSGLYLSILLHPTEPAGRIPRWTLAAAVAACEACRRVSGLDVRIKWPNDLLCGGRKLGGILAEMRTNGTRTDLVLGLGVNVHQAAGGFPSELADSATSLRGECHRGIFLERERLAALYLIRLAALAEDLERDRWGRVARRWEGLALGALGARVVTRGRDGGGSGITRGIDGTGALRIERDDGSIVSVTDVDAVTAEEAG
ncbi:MAG: biotin--[acetyl-CoA-carboxylase] ligase [bacterium]|nr:biotin--[acetyl-CoA-carboxylase] ligase [bacterium]